MGEGVVRRVLLGSFRDIGETFPLSCGITGKSENFTNRFVRMTTSNSSSNLTVTFPFPSLPSPSSPRSKTQTRTQFYTTTVALAQLNAEIFNVGFTKAIGCATYPRGGCDGIQRDFSFVDDEGEGGGGGLEEYWAHKYVVDLDGMGASPRFFALMESESAVVKGSVYREFWEGWVQPWSVLFFSVILGKRLTRGRLHFIPLSIEYKEIYDIYAYFSGPTQSMLRAANLSLPLTSAEPGDSQLFPSKNPKHHANARDRSLRRIAKAGRKWKREVVRQVDMEGTSLNFEGWLER